MFNDYILVGPKNDPAKTKIDNSIKIAKKKIIGSRSLFISRGDDGGTYKRTFNMGRIGRIPDAKNDKWYLSVGQGWEALNIAVNKNAYIISDRATWIRFNNKESMKFWYQMNHYF